MQGYHTGYTHLSRSRFLEGVFPSLPLCAWSPGPELSASHWRGARGSQRERVLAFEALLSPGGDHPFFPDEEFHCSVGRDPHSTISVPTAARGDSLSHTLCGNAREPQDLCT